MKIIERHVIVPVEDLDEWLLINALTGYIGAISKRECEIIKEWSKTGEINVVDEETNEFFSELKRNRFVVDSNEEEERTVEQILERCRDEHKKSAEETGAAVFVLTYRCNFACPYCYEGKNHDENNTVMSKEQVDKIFSLYNNHLDHISFFGGEPLLPETRDVVEYITAKAPEAKYEITTNGYYLGDYLDLFKKLAFDVIVITLDGPKELHNATRKLRNNAPTYDVIMANIEKALMQGIPIKIRMNVSDRNVEECISLQQELEKKYYDFYSNAKLRFEMQPIFQLDFTAKNELHEKVLFNIGDTPKDIAKRNAMFYTVPPVLKDFVYKGKGFCVKYCNCDAETRRRFFDPDGDIYSCILSLRNKKATVGRYYPDYFLKEKSILTRNIDSVEECSKCKLKFLCGGGCANGAIDENGNVMHPNCAETQNQIFVELPRLYKEVKKKNGK